MSDSEEMPKDIIFRHEEFSRRDGDNVRQIEKISSLDGEIVKFVGSATMLLHGNGPGAKSLPIRFLIPADTLEEAFDNHEEAMKEQAEEVKKDLQSKVAQQSSKIIDPRQDPNLMSKAQGMRDVQRKPPFRTDK